MDSLHAIGFYVSAAVAGAGGIGAALNGHSRRGTALALTGLGVAGIYASLSAGFAALVVLLSYIACGLLVARPDYRNVDQVAGSVWRQLGAISAALLFIALAYAAYRGDFAQAAFRGGPFNSLALARLLFAHDGLATDAVGVLVVVALVGAALSWRRERPRDEREGRR